GPLDTVYLGGGTPSLLAPADVGRLLDTAGRHFGLSAGSEITLEAHPTTVTMRRLEGYHARGVTRISFGAESLQPTELAALGRNYTPKLALHALELARRCGYRSIAVDLMYGLPGQTLNSWEATLRAALGAQVHHLSLYPLSVEPRTVLARAERQGRLVLPEEEAIVDMYHSACRLLRDAGFEHYELSNWALPGHRCRHNLACWRDAQYYGVGVGAHGYLHPVRTENISNLKRYLEAIEAGASAVGSREVLDEDASFTERVLLGMRLLADGLPLNDLETRPGHSDPAGLQSEITALASSGLVKVERGRMWLSEDAVPVANDIWARLLRAA
ncbi:MAG TPA: radical SAM family heme chaperone HemW, partial [Chloroflexota bacterium]|nr:radical SAM family heme chaperone HemW [Chloroflexota bacterium]